MRLSRMLGEIRSGRRDIDLCNATLSDEDVEVVAKALVGSHVLFLALGNDHISADGAISLADAIPGAKNLSVLHLYDNSIGPRGATALAGSLSRSRLTSLNMTHTDIGVDGIKAIAAALPTSNLAYLGLAKNHIDDDGAKAIAAALPASKIDTLDLSNNDIGREGMDALLQGISHSTLRYFFYARIGDENNAQLQPALARVEDALANANDNRRILTLEEAFVSSRMNPPTPAANFARADGDTALGHRIARFLIG
jgi:Ran GTPase-activating protein (RanGAP) involved in mRNA processing and transport